MGRLALLVFNEAKIPPEMGLKDLNAKLLKAFNDKLRRILSCKHEEYEKFKTYSVFNLTSKSAREKIRAFFSQAKEEDILLFYYIGHGYKEKGRPLFFLFKDSFRRKSKDRTFYSPDIDTSKTITIKEIEAEISGTRAKKIILILDCCYSGTALRQITLPPDTEKSVFIVYSATSASIAAMHTDKDIGSGAFSIGLLQGIENCKAASITGRITFRNAISYAKKWDQENYSFQKPRTHGDPELEEELIYFVTDSFIAGKLYNMPPTSIYSKIAKILELIKDNPQKNQGELHSIITKTRPKEFLVPYKTKEGEIKYNILNSSTFYEHLRRCKQLGLITDLEKINLTSSGRSMFSNNCERYNFYLRDGLLEFLKKYGIERQAITDKIVELIKEGLSSAVRPLWESFLIDGKRIGFNDFRYVIKLLSVIRVIQYTNKRYYLPAKRALI